MSLRVSSIDPPSDCTSIGLVTIAATGDVITAMIAITVITAKILFLICSPPRLKTFRAFELPLIFSLRATGA